VVVHSVNKLYCRPKIPNYVVNLDLPPEERWQQIGRERSTQVIILNCIVEDNVGHVKFTVEPHVTCGLSFAHG